MHALPFEIFLGGQFLFQERYSRHILRNQASETIRLQPALDIVHIRIFCCLHSFQKRLQIALT